jgi:hypothetical protein
LLALAPDAAVMAMRVDADQVTAPSHTGSLGSRTGALHRGMMLAEFAAVGCRVIRVGRRLIRRPRDLK